LVVEAWIGPDGIDAAAAEFEQHSYRYKLRQEFRFAGATFLLPTTPMKQAAYSFGLQKGFDFR
jgi:hypothetical protein